MRPIDRLIALASGAAVLATTACAGVGGGLAPLPARSARALLDHTVDSLVTRPVFRTAEWGILVVDPAAGDTLYARQPATLMVPASNMKIITGAVALTDLGPDFRFHTTIAAHGPVRNGVLEGDLVVTGRGDPTVSDTALGDARRGLLAIADSLAAHGVRQIRGVVQSGADNFPGSPVGLGWEVGDLAYDYGAGVDELLYNYGTAPVVEHRPTGDTTVDAPVANPTRDYLLRLADALRARGISVGGVTDSVVPRDTVRLDTLFVTASMPLRDIMPYFLKPSQNQIGEVLLRTLGLERTGMGTPDSGLAVVRRQLTAWGVPRDAYSLHDGSGLSRADLVSPETIVRVLDVMRQSPNFDVFYNALPIAGVDGTIRRRMRGTPAANNVHAKTGSLGAVRSLSGYVRDAKGHLLIFSTLANKWTTPSDSVTHTADQIAAALAAYRP